MSSDRPPASTSFLIQESVARVCRISFLSSSLTFHHSTPAAAVEGTSRIFEIRGSAGRGAVRSWGGRKVAHVNIVRKTYETRHCWWSTPDRRRREAATRDAHVAVSVWAAFRACRRMCVQQESEPATSTCLQTQGQQLRVALERERLTEVLDKQGTGGSAEV